MNFELAREILGLSDSDIGNKYVDHLFQLGFLEGLVEEANEALKENRNITPEPIYKSLMDVWGYETPHKLIEIFDYARINCGGKMLEPNRLMELVSNVRMVDNF